MMQVYFLQRGSGGPIKIGKTRQLEHRVKSLSTGCAEKLVVLATYRGGGLAEKYLHVTLAKHRLEGEWFSPHADVLAVVERVRAGTFKPGRLQSVTRDEARHERAQAFLGSTFATALSVAYGEEPGWAHQAADDSGAGTEAVKQWRKLKRVPRTHHMLNIARNNPAMKMWLMSAGVAMWMAREFGVDEHEAYTVALTDFDGVKKAWYSPKPDGLGQVLREMWGARSAKAAALREESEKQIWVF